MSHPEDLLITSLIKSGDSKTLVKQGVTKDLFILRDREWKWIDKYIAKHGKPPSKAAYKAKFPNNPFYASADGTDLENFCEEVKLSFSRHRMTEIMDNAIDLLMSGQIDHAMSSLGTELLQVQAIVADAQDDYDTATDWKESYEEVKERILRVKKTGSAGIPTGFPALDEESGGFQPGWLSIISARTGVGKTWTMVRSATEAAMNGYTVLYYSLEQSRHQIAYRTHNFLSRHYGKEVFKSTALMRGEGFDLLEYRDFLKDLENNLPGQIIINDTRRGRVNPMTVAAGIERTDPDVVMVDYMTLMAMEGDGGWQSVGKLSTDLKQIGERFEVPIVCGSQLNRSGEISRADSISHDADMMIRLTKKSQHVMKMQMDKFRHGQDGFHWFCEYNPTAGVYDEISQQDADEIMASDGEVD